MRRFSGRHEVTLVPLLRLEQVYCSVRSETTAARRPSTDILETIFGTEETYLFKRHKKNYIDSSRTHQDVLYELKALDNFTKMVKHM